MPPHLLSNLPEGTPILVGFSGGADSRVLLDLLVSYAKGTGANIYAAHVNHGIRGKEADRDEEFCRSVAEGYNIKFFCLHADVPRIARESGKSIELAAREVRYAYFEKVMRENNIPLLAVAHNANDNLETVLFNLTRGTALSGLSGIPPIRECASGLVIRPILSMTREDIIEYTKEHSLDFVTDSTNTDTLYARNRIRSEVIPALKVINPNAEKNAVETTALLRRDAEYLSSLTDNFLLANLRDGALPLFAINEVSEAISSRAVMKMYASFSERMLEGVHVRDVLELCRRAAPHSRLSLPAGIYAVIENGALVFTKDDAKTEKKDFFIEVKEGHNPISQTNSEIVIGKTHNQINIYKKSIQFYIDSAKILGSLVLRERREGDKILVGRMHKSVKKLMCDKKIPLDERHRLPVICDDRGIVAIPFVGVRDGCRIKNASDAPESALEINFYLY